MDTENINDPRMENSKRRMKRRMNEKKILREAFNLLNRRYKNLGPKCTQKFRALRGTLEHCNGGEFLKGIPYSLCFDFSKGVSCNITNKGETENITLTPNEIAMDMFEWNTYVLKIDTKTKITIQKEANLKKIADLKKIAEIEEQAKIIAKDLERTTELKVLERLVEKYENETRKLLEE